MRSIWWMAHHHTLAKVIFAAVAPPAACGFVVSFVAATATSLGLVAGGLLLLVLGPVAVFGAPFALGLVEQRPLAHFGLSAVVATSVCTGLSLAAAPLEPFEVLIAWCCAYVLALIGCWAGALVGANRYDIVVPTRGTCPGCGYCVRGLPRRVCPECGRPFIPEEVGLTADECPAGDAGGEPDPLGLPAEFARLGPYARTPVSAAGTATWQCAYQECPIDDLRGTLLNDDEPPLDDGKWHVFGPDSRSLYRVAGAFAQLLLPDDGVPDADCAALAASIGRCGILAGSLQVDIRSTDGRLELYSGDGRRRTRVALKGLSPRDLKAAYGELDGHSGLSETG